MIKLSVMYPRQEGGTFDLDYYCNRHMALVRQLLGPALKGMAVDEGVATPQGPAPYVAIGHLWFDSVDAFQAALADHYPALQADIPNYTNVAPVFQVSALRIAAEPGAAQAAG